MGFISTSINKGSYGGLKNLKRLESRLAKMPDDIEAANKLAADKTVIDVTENLIKRGRPGRFLKVESTAYGKLGFKLNISTNGVATSIGLMESPAGAGRRYSGKWAANIFMNSESGFVGRRAFNVVADKKDLIVSHNSPFSHWKTGMPLPMIVNVPELGAYYWSSRTGVESIPIKTMAKNFIVENLNKRYSEMLKKK